MSPVKRMSALRVEKEPLQLNGSVYRDLYPLNRINEIENRYRALQSATAGWLSYCSENRSPRNDNRTQDR